MPSSFDEADRPTEMLQGERTVVPDFLDPSELLYRRCDPNHLDEAGRVLPIAVEQFNLSVLRSRFASDPDHARWDSRVAAKDGEALVYPDWHVIEVSVNDAMLERRPENPSAQPHYLRPVHAPIADNYAHSELGLFKGEGAAKRLEREGDAKGEESKLAKRQFRAMVAERAKVRLKAGEGSSFRR